MRLNYLVALVLCALPALSQTDSQWTLDRSRVTYSITHPMHQVIGMSRAAKGRGICHDGMCEFLIAAPVNSFDSGDSNRDLHTLQVTRGAQFPMIQVRTRLPLAAPASGTIYADIQIQFAGQTIEYKHVAFEKTTTGNEARTIGTIPATCSDFKIDPPSFLTIPVRNEIPVRVDMTWQPM